MQDIPKYLHPYIATQDPALYTAIDHAGWRFILKISQAFFSKHAHEMYLEGLEKTGISTERIPLISDMDEKLKRFGWRAAPVCGFIPPSVFMEFLSLGILPIACDMRKLEHLSYTPAPDIVHEAAGHAPIIADPEYAHYLRQYGEVSRKSIFSSQDWNLYVAIRNLSDTKENPKSTLEEIQAAENCLNKAIQAIDHVSEATELARMSWWTIEYGLIGSMEDPKIYGAGLLSSLGESYHCLRPEITKIPLTLNCVEVTYDITKPQPQLFIAPDFQTLTRVLDELTETMAFRKGGVTGLNKAKKAATVTTTEWESGLQISGILESFSLDSNNNPTLIKFSGPVQLSVCDQELAGFGARKFSNGFITPVGLWKFENKKSNGKNKVVFDSGITIQGQFKKEIKNKERVVALVFENSSIVDSHGIVLVPQSKGERVIACGEKVVSVFGGAADRAKYLEATGGFQQPPGNPKTNLTSENRLLDGLYQQVREVRESGKVAQQLSRLNQIQSELDKKYPQDWLLRFELLELNSTYSLKAAWAQSTLQRLRQIAGESKPISEMIERGLALL